MPHEPEDDTARATHSHALALSNVVLTLGIREVLPATPRARVVRLDLRGTPFEYQAGQAVLVGSVGGLKRPYSLATPPEEARRTGCLELLVGVDPNGAPGPHLTLDPGHLVAVEGPLGSFTFPHEPAEQRFVFIAGGTGIAPLRAMLHRALGTPHESIGLFYSARSPDEFAYDDEWRRLARDGRIELRQTVTRSVGELWSGPRGRIDRAQLASMVQDSATLCFVCGPPAFVADTAGLLTDVGIPPSRIRVEQWT
jgi:ferredoxin-NADP reductase